VVHDARRVDEVEDAAPEARLTEVGLDKQHAVETESRGCGGAEGERGAREIGAHHHAIGAREVQTHLAGAASDVGNARISGNRAVEEPGEGITLGTGAEAVQTLTRRIARERRALVEAAHRLGHAIRSLVCWSAGPLVRRQSQIWDTVSDVEAGRASSARPLGRERAAACRAGDELPSVHR
jgi:hypothetical protein